METTTDATSVENAYNTIKSIDQQLEKQGFELIDIHDTKHFNSLAQRVAEYSINSDQLPLNQVVLIDGIRRIILEIHVTKNKTGTNLEITSSEAFNSDRLNEVDAYQRALDTMSPLYNKICTHLKEKDITPKSYVDSEIMYTNGPTFIISTFNLSFQKDHSAQ